MSIVKLNNRSVKDVTAFGSITSLGSLTHIATQTASSSASISFTSGIDSTYKEYVFYFVDIHPSATDGTIQFQGSTDSGSNYGVTLTNTLFRAYHNESSTYTALEYKASHDLAQSTNFATLNSGATGNDNDQSCVGYLHLFNPSSTTFVKHFLTNFNTYNSNDYSMQTFTGGYFNTTSAIDAIQFKMDSGNIDSGQILLFGLN
tara:strand:- start:100 stop:708 length:609 start_codon:yes stop_codon:yes gene_type:complete